MGFIATDSRLLQSPSALIAQRGAHQHHYLHHSLYAMRADGETRLQGYFCLIDPIDSDLGSIEEGKHTIICYFSQDVLFNSNLVPFTLAELWGCLCDPYKLTGGP